jgi:hypothetical protein
MKLAYQKAQNHQKTPAVAIFSASTTIQGNEGGIRSGFRGKGVLPYI